MAVVAAMSDDKTFVIGLEAENVKRMMDGKPFRVHLKDHDGPDVLIYIFYGKDRDDLAQQLSPGIKPETKIIDKSKVGKA